MVTASVVMAVDSPVVLGRLDGRITVASLSGRDICVSGAAVGVSLAGACICSTWGSGAVGVGGVGSCSMVPGETADTEALRLGRGIGMAVAV